MCELGFENFGFTVVDEPAVVRINECVASVFTSPIDVNYARTSHLNGCGGKAFPLPIFLDLFLKRSPKSFEGGFACPKHQEGFSRGNTRPEKLFKQIRCLKMELEWLKKNEEFWSRQKGPLQTHSPALRRLLDERVLFRYL